MHPLKDQFLLDPSVTFLNFGSFGACPKPVFEKYREYQRQLEAEPVRFIVYEGMELLREARQRLGAYVNCHEDDVVFMTNPSYAINTVARSLRLEPGDEVLATDLEYGAVDRTWKFICKKTGARYVRSKIGLPVSTREAFLEDFWKGFSDRTKAVVVSHITSATGLVLPVAEICAEAKRRGLLTIVDGAHAPGQIPLDLSLLDADIYTGACHKWMMAPKGASFLYVKREHQGWIDPLVVSWGYDADHPSHSRFLDYHQANGTRDFSAFLCVPDCIDFMKENDWPAVSANCRKLVRENAQRFCNLVGSQPISPMSGEWLGQMFSIPVRTNDPVALYNKLFDEYRIEIPVTVQDGRYYLRYSIQAYNDQQDLDKLFEALKEIKNTSDLLST